MSGPARSPSCSIHHLQQCQSIHNPHHHHCHWHPTSPVATTTHTHFQIVCVLLSVTSPQAQGCFLSGLGSKQLIQGKSQSVLETWPSPLRQNTQRSPGSTGWRCKRGNNNTTSESTPPMRASFPETESPASLSRWNSPPTLDLSLIEKSFIVCGASTSCQQTRSTVSSRNAANTGRKKSFVRGEEKICLAALLKLTNYMLNIWFVQRLACSQLN